MPACTRIVSPGLTRGRPAVAQSVPRAGQVVGAHQPVEGRLDLLPVEAGRIDVEHPAAGGRLRLGARSHRHRLRALRRARHRDRTARTALRTRYPARDRGCCRRTCSARRRRAARRCRSARPAAAAAAAPRFHCVSPCLRYDTSTAALRLSSPSMNHSKPRLISVGGSTTNSPAVTASFAAADEGPAEPDPT